MNEEHRSRTVSWRTPRNLWSQSFLRPKTSPIAVLLQPESESRIALGRPPRGSQTASRLSPSRCSALTIKGDLPDMGVVLVLGSRIEAPFPRGDDWLDAFALQEVTKLVCVIGFVSRQGG
jgi:hypothetical protein